MGVSLLAHLRHIKRVARVILVLIGISYAEIITLDPPYYCIEGQGNNPLNLCQTVNFA